MVNVNPKLTHQEINLLLNLNVLVCLINKKIQNISQIGYVKKTCVYPISDKIESNQSESKNIQDM